MKKVCKNKTFWTVLIAFMLIVGVSVKSAMAYFTTYVTAKGGYELTLSDEGEIEEKVADMTKSISLKNTGEQPEYVRVKVFFGSQTGVSVEYSAESGWSQGDDGYWYYDEVLPVGGSTSILKVKLTADESVVPSFNVVVIQECTSVTKDGTADWSNVEERKIDEKNSEGGNS